MERIIETERLILRPWEDSDAESLYTYAKDPRVGPMACWPPHTSVENSLEIIRTVLSEPNTYAVCLKEDNVAIGSIGLFQSETRDAKDGELELGFWIGAPFWGQGLIPEAAKVMQKVAFDELGAEILWCAHWENNDKSRRAQEKCGFVLHHIEKDNYKPLIDETRTDCVNYMTREHWHERSIKLRNAAK